MHGGNTILDSWVQQVQAGSNPAEVAMAMWRGVVVEGKGNKLGKKQQRLRANAVGGALSTPAVVSAPSSTTQPPTVTHGGFASGVVAKAKQLVANAASKAKMVGSLAADDVKAAGLSAAKSVASGASKVSYATKVVGRGVVKAGKAAVDAAVAHDAPRTEAGITAAAAADASPYVKGTVYVPGKGAGWDGQKSDEVAPPVADVAIEQPTYARRVAKYVDLGPETAPESKIGLDRKINREEILKNGQRGAILGSSPKEQGSGITGSHLAVGGGLLAAGLGALAIKKHYDAKKLEQQQQLPYHQQTMQAQQHHVVQPHMNWAHGQR